MREFTEDEANRHNALTKTGWALIKARIFIQDEEPTRLPGPIDRWRLRRASRFFERALAINPDGWSSMWALGKIAQRLGDQDAALGWFAGAFAVNPDHPEIAREAGIAAMDHGRVDEALRFCTAAVSQRPDDPGLICNLGLAFCMAGRDAEAERCLSEAVRLDPTDEVSANVLHVVRSIASGERPRSTRLTELFPY